MIISNQQNQGRLACELIARIVQDRNPSFICTLNQDVFFERYYSRDKITVVPGLPDYLSSFKEADQNSADFSLRLPTAEELKPRKTELFGKGSAQIDITRHSRMVLDRLPSLAAELVRLKVDVIVTPGANDTRAAKNATRTIPIVFLGTVSDPVSLGLVDSLASLGGNLTGFTSSGGVLAGKQLELLKETIPKLFRVAVLWNPQNAGSTQVWKESQPPAKELGLQLHSMAVNSANDIESGFRDSVTVRSGALFVTGGGLIARNHKRIISLAIKNLLHGDSWS